jgi:hypothetical protein
MPSPSGKKDLRYTFRGSRSENSFMTIFQRREVGEGQSELPASAVFSISFTLKYLACTKCYVFRYHVHPGNEGKNLFLHFPFCCCLYVLKTWTLILY